MRLSQSQFPGQAGVLDRGERRRAGPAVVPADQHDIDLPLRDSRCDRTDAYFRHQFHAHPRGAVRVFQVMDKLRQVLNGINIMMRRR